MNYNDGARPGRVTCVGGGGEPGFCARAIRGVASASGGRLSVSRSPGPYPRRFWAKTRWWVSPTFSSSPLQQILNLQFTKSAEFW